MVPNIDPERVRKLAGWALTQNDIASFVGCSQSLVSLGFSSFCAFRPALSQNCQPHATRRMRRWMNRRIFGRKPALDGSDEYSSCNASRRNS